MDLHVRPIGYVRNERDRPIDDDWDLVDSIIELNADVVEPSAIAGLDEFSHIEVIFVFDKVAADDTVRGARHPRGNTAWPEVGILAQRAKDRPNRLGTTVCEVMRVGPGARVSVRGLDAIDGTPVLDIKPYFAEFAPRGDVFQPEWSAELMAGYWTSEPDSRVTPDPERWLEEVRRSPQDVGHLELIVRRPDVDTREVIANAELDLVVGLVGDNWLDRGSASRADGSADPDAQLNLMNIRCARLVAGDDSRIPLAGDQLFVDLDLTPENLPTGTLLTIGSAVIEVTAKPHTGCAKFTRRFGLACHRWINGVNGRRERLRGICAKVVTAGTIHQGDRIEVTRPAGSPR